MVKMEIVVLQLIYWCFEVGGHQRGKGIHIYAGVSKSIFYTVYQENDTASACYNFKLAYFLCNISAKNYQNRLIYVEVIASQSSVIFTRTV